MKFSNVVEEPCRDREGEKGQYDTPSLLERGDLITVTQGANGLPPDSGFASAPG